MKTAVSKAAVVSVKILQLSPYMQILCPGFSGKWEPGDTKMLIKKTETA
ncbi:MAG TPA: hypothetical protein VHO03_10150 [Ignavibacteriales bacterium]|nr:hypothetical protein [Ignavibacteriales bacterium]